MNLDGLIKQAIEHGASDIHFTVGAEPTMRLHGKLTPITDEKMTNTDTVRFAKEILTEKQIQHLLEVGEVDCAYEVDNGFRLRVNIFKQRNNSGIALRVIPNQIPSMESLGLPAVIKKLAEKRRGLILVTGPTGSGKSTTLATMIDYMNEIRDEHIITIEDPIEYMHTHKQCLVNQRELGADTQSFGNALRGALRQDPDVILVGEMRDKETIEIALRAAETGHLVLSTLHTVGAVNTMDRIIDVFPAEQQEQIRVQLSAVVEGVVSQQLMRTSNGKGRVAAFEIMLATPAVRNLIREGKTHQLLTPIQTGASQGMITMDTSLLGLYRRNLIDRKTLLSYAVDREQIEKAVMMG
ncbi:type IV pilus twitching motility protein PilT [Streptococcus gallolyticus]|nr:type IV pilus twitching motility protein PilT [Streptococcus gallolyticus]MBY5040584.1 type IV pilus twitching motility protein PilT [Streptococcus gallolyticus]